MSLERHLMPANPLNVTPRFKIGDRVTIAFPGHYRGSTDSSWKSLITKVI